MVESQQAGNGELRSPEVVDTAEQPTALVPADADATRGRVGRWWKRVLGAGSQGASGLAFPGAGRLRKLEERQEALSRDLSEKVEAIEGRTLDLLEDRLEKLSAEQEARIVREVEERVAREASRLRTRIAGVAALATAGVIVGLVAMLMGLGAVSP